MLLASALATITPFAAFFLSGEVTGVENLPFFVLSFNGSARHEMSTIEEPKIDTNDSLAQFGVE